MDVFNDTSREGVIILVIFSVCLHDMLLKLLMLRVQTRRLPFPFTS